MKSIYSGYFEIIDSFFGSIKHYLRDEPDSHIDLGIEIASYPLISDLIIDSIYDLGDEILKFWSSHSKILYEKLPTQDNLKCLYSGDITPIILENFIKKSALYIDTVIIPDPILNMSLFQEQITSDKKYYLNKLIRHVFNIWKMKDFILAETDIEPLLVLPINLNLIEPKKNEILLKNAESSFIRYINKVFEKQFKEKDEIFDYMSSKDSPAAIYSNFKNHNILPKEFQSFTEFEDFLNSFYSTQKYLNMPSKTIGYSFCLYVFSQFIRVQEHKYFCEKLIAEPIYDYDLAWFFYNYESRGMDLDASISNVLQRDQFDWISNVPLKALKVFREENRLEYMRSIFRHGITDLKAKNDKDLLAVSEQLEQNIKDAFERQKSELVKIQNDVRKIEKKEIPIVSFGFLAGLIPYLNIPVSLLTVGRDLKKLIFERKKKREFLNNEKNSFISLLLKSYERK